MAGNFRGIQFLRKGSTQRFSDLFSQIDVSELLRPQCSLDDDDGTFVDRGPRGSGGLRCIARCLKVTYERHSRKSTLNDNKLV